MTKWNPPKACSLCERLWVLHTRQQKNDCRKVIDYIKNPAPNKLIDGPTQQPKQRGDTSYQEVYDL